MREFELIFDRGLTRGIRTNAQEGLNLQTVYTAYNFKAGKHGLEPYVPITIQSGYEIGTQHWPYPIIFNGNDRNYLVTRQSSDSIIRLYEITGTGLVAKYAFNVSEVTVPTCIDFADFGHYAVFTTNAYSLLHNTISNTYTPDIPTASYSLVPPVELCCNFRGQFIYARPKVFSNSLPIPSHLEDKFIGYSDIGNLNLSMSNSAIAGSTYIPTAGSILRILPTNNHIIVYCSRDIFALTPEISPVFTYSWKKISNVGISWKHGVAGDLNNHVAVLTTGELLMVGDDLKTTNLDYSERFNAPGATTVVYDPQYNEWRISDSDGSYVLTGKGLTTCYQRITGILHNTLYGAGGDATNLEAILTTDTLNFGMNGIKTITGIEVGGQFPSTSGTVSIGYKHDSYQAAFSYSQPVVINPMGWVGMPVSGTDFRITLTFNTYAGLYLKYLKIRWKMSDLRSLRGVYSPPPRGQYAD